MQAFEHGSELGRARRHQRGETSRSSGPWRCSATSNIASSAVRSRRRVFALATGLDRLEPGGVAAAFAAHEPGLDQIEHHRAQRRVVVARETFQQRAARQRPVLLDVGEHGLPQRAARRAAARAQPRELALIGAQREPEHVGDDLVAQALLAQLAHQIREHHVGDRRELRALAGRGGELAISTVVWRTIAWISSVAFIGSASWVTEAVATR